VRGGRCTRGEQIGCTYWGGGGETGSGGSEGREIYERRLGRVYILGGEEKLEGKRGVREGEQVGCTGRE